MQLLGKAQDPSFWEEVRSKEIFKDFREMLLCHWENDCVGYEPEALRYSEYKLFWTTGDRATYQKSYWSRRYNLDVAAMLALIYPEEQKYVDFAMEMIYTICDEYSWCIPAHQKVLEINDNCRIDLFASETVYRFAEILTLLGDRLEPLIRNRIMAEVERRIVKPFTSVGNYGWWENGHMNWTAVCMGSVANTMMLLFPEKADEAFIERANRSIEGFLEGFKDDGMCLEGCAYWGYGFGFFMLYADMVRRYTDGKVDFFKRDKVKTVATFLQKMFLTEGCTVSFADGGAKFSYDVGRMHYLKNEYPDDILVYDRKYASFGYGKFCILLRDAIWLDERLLADTADETVETECFAPDSHWLVKRTKNYGFAAKGGYNKEPHNHNDIGNFIFAKEGKQIICDMGAGPYTRQYFSNDTRYQMIECRSGGHNLPIVAGVEQSFGEQFKAKDVTYENGVLTMDITGAYECEGLESIIRSFKLDDDGITLTDKFVYSGEGDIICRMYSHIEPALIEPGKVRIGICTLSYDPAKAECTAHKDLRTNKSSVIYRIEFKLYDGVKEFSCSLK